MTQTRSGWLAQKPSVICIGLAAFDYCWRVDELPGPSSSKVRAHAFATKGGGMAATAAVTVSRLGGSASFWGRAGNDPEGRAMREELYAAGVNVDDFRLFDGTRSSTSSVIVDRRGERQIANFRGAGQPDDPDWLPLRPLAAVGAVLADPRWPSGAAAAFAAARKAGTPTVLDADVADRAVFEQLLPLTDHAVFSSAALTAFAGADEQAALSKVRSFGCAVAAVTKGEHGVAWLSAGEFNQRPAFRVDAVDTTGAGDVFHGAYAFAVAAGAPLDEGMGFAAAAAALKCMRPDGRSGIPGFDDTVRLWRTSP